MNRVLSNHRNNSGNHPLRGVLFMYRKSIIFILAFMLSVIQGQNGPDRPGEAKADSLKKSGKERPSKKDKKRELKKFAELVKDYEKIEGLFDLYWNQDKNSAYLAVNPDQYEKIFLCNVTRQSGDAYRFDSGAMLQDFPFMFKKVGEKIQFIHVNTSYRADEGTPMARAIAGALPNSILASSNILSKPDSLTGDILLELKDFFLTDKLPMVGYITGRWKKKYSFDKDNSYFNRLTSFPENTEIDVVLNYKSEKPHRSITLPDSRSMLHRYHFSLSSIPESDYRPRIADDRVGHFLTYYQDYSNVETDTPYQYRVNRWNLVKKDPDARLSEPVKPIVFWIENTTPEKYRAAIARGALMWNEAFQRIGFKNAVVVKEMPDDADWDPADVRYNTIRWIVQPGGGYAVGPSRANPFTGEIYDADIRVSADFVRHFYREYEEFVTPLSNEEVLNAVWHESEPVDGAAMCEYSREKQRNMDFSINYLMAAGKLSESELDEFVQEGLTDLIVHEVGHTLGLRHNFRASHIYPLKRLQDKEFTEEYGVTGSVMDYNPINLSPDGEPQGAYYHTTLGTYDYWVIEYAYRPYDSREYASEADMLEDIAGRASEPLFAYCTDEQAKGYSIKGMDPSCSLYDMTADPLEYYGLRAEMSQELWRTLPEKFGKEPGKYQKLRSVFNQGLGEYSNMARNIPKYIGGIYAYRSHIGDPNGKAPFQIVPADEQRRALRFIEENLFAPDAFDFPPELLNQLVPSYQPDFQGSVWNRTRWDYPIHGVIFNIQGNALARLYSKYVLVRLQDNELKFPDGEEKFTMAEMFESLRKSLWQELDSRESINSYRRRLQQFQIHILTQIMLRKEAEYPRDAVSLARYDLEKLAVKIRRVKNHPAFDVYTQAHLTETLAKIDAALKATSERDG